MSETLTALALDYSSMFNVNTAAAMEKVQAALVGNVKSIRSTSGFDITEATIADLAASLGVEKSVRNMSQMEKRLLRIISLMNQMKATGAMQDLARTIEQPANQIRVLQSQLQELGVWLGNVFIGKLGKILPYINGFVMALKEIIKVLAIFVGYDGAGSISDPIQVGEQASSGIASNLGSASKSAKEIKKSLMGFDVLNVIQSPSDTSGGGGGAGGIGEIDPAILNALSKYDSLMGDVRMKAIDIRDKILDWLGFTKTLNGEWQFSGNKLLKNLVKWFSDLNILAKIFIGLVVYKAFTKILTVVGKLLTPFTRFINTFGKFITLVKQNGLSQAISILVNNFNQWKTSLTLTQKALEMFKSGLSVISGIYLIVDAFRDLKQEGVSISGILQALIGVILLVQGAITAVGLAMDALTVKAAVATAGISLIIAAVAGVIAYFTTTKEETEKAASALGNYNTAMQNVRETSQQTFETEMVQIGVLQKLTKELEIITDSNGKVKRGYEERADFILGKLSQASDDEYKRTGNQITINGQLVSSYNDISASVDNLITKLKAEAYIEAYRQEYIENLKQQKINNDNIIRTQDEINKLADIYNDYVKNGMMTEDEANAAFQKAAKDKKDRLAELNKLRGTINKNILDYENLEYNIASGNYLELEKQVNDFSGNSKIKLEDVSSALSKSITDNTAKAEKTIGDTLTRINLSTASFKVSADTTSAQNSLNSLLNNFTKGRTLSMSATTAGQVSMSLRAMGGTVDTGEMFIAREAGPELVGRIGNTTTVMNNNQIVESVSRGVAQAVSSVMGRAGGGSYNFYLDGKELTATVVERMRREANISGMGVY